MGFQQYIAFTILVPFILSMWPSQLSLCARMKFIVFLRFISFPGLDTRKRNSLFYSWRWTY
jgi:hypothetical protein